ncbi:MAG: hypothetical protein JWL97_3779, partial [Gemmatimonadales bacterium]|nr:hypothetical protein [Gemmatimonadales bacterium]
MRAYDLCYEPPERSYEWMVELHPSTCLIIGEVPDSERDYVQGIAGDVRERSSSPLASILRHGCYAFWKDESWHVLVLMNGRAPGAAERGRWRSTDDDNHMVHASAIYQAEWKQATPFAGSSQFGVGDMVRAQDSGIIGQVKGISA